MGTDISLVLSLEILTKILKSNNTVVCQQLPYFLLAVNWCLLLNVSGNSFVL